MNKAMTPIVKTSVRKGIGSWNVGVDASIAARPEALSRAAVPPTTDGIQSEHRTEAPSAPIASADLVRSAPVRTAPDSSFGARFGARPRCCTTRGCSASTSAALRDARPRALARLATDETFAENRGEALSTPDASADLVSSAPVRTAPDSSFGARFGARPRCCTTRPSHRKQRRDHDT
jgi:hypothetical protein